MSGADLREAQHRLGLSQQALADALGLTQTYIGLMERDQRPIERRTELAVRYLLMVGIDWPTRFKQIHRASSIKWSTGHTVRAGRKSRLSDTRM